MATEIDLKFRGLAEAQGVQRPLEMLVRMPSERRRIVADLLGCRFDASECAAAQSWRIINENLHGLQARTHSIPEQLTPFSRNNTWWEILTRAARRCGVRCNPGLEDKEVERLLFARLADSFVARNIPSDQDPLALWPQIHPQLGEAIGALRLSENGTRALLYVLLCPQREHGADLREGLNRLTDWLRPKVRWWWRVSLSGGLQLLQQLLTPVFAAWVKCGFLERPQRNLARVCAALVVIHFQALVDRTLDEVDLAGV